MRIYLSGTVSSGKEAEFMPTELYFATNDCDDNLTPAKDCLRLSGQLCECTMENDNTWSARWKGVDIDTDREYTEDVDMDAKELLQFIVDNEMTLANMDAYCEVNDTYVTVTNLEFVTGDEVVEVPEELLEEEINFLW